MRRLLTLVVLLFLVAGSFSVVGCDGESCKQLRAQLNNLKGDIERLETLIADLRSQMTDETSSQGSLASKTAQLRMAEVDLETRTMMMQESLLDIWRKFGTTVVFAVEDNGNRAGKPAADSSFKYPFEQFQRTLRRGLTSRQPAASIRASSFGSSRVALCS